MISETNEFSSNEERTYPIEEGGIVSLELDETGEFYWKQLSEYPLNTVDPITYPRNEETYLSYLDQNSREDVEFAFRVAYAGHDKYPNKEENRFRKDGTTHTMFHLYDVCRIGAEYKLDAKTLQVLLLHDKIEDTLFERECIADLFGEEIAADVEGLTNIRRVEVDETGMKEDEAATALKKFNALVEGRYRVVIGKLIDRLTSMRTIQYLKPESKQRNALETRNVYVPLAEKSGLTDLADELAQLSDEVLEPDLATSAVVLQDNEQERQKYEKSLQILIGYPVISHPVRYIHAYQNLNAETADIPGLFQFSVVATCPQHVKELQQKIESALSFSESYLVTEVSDHEVVFKRGLIEISIMTPDVYDEKTVRISDVLEHGFDKESEEGKETVSSLNRRLSDVVHIIDEYTVQKSLSASEALTAITGEMKNPRFMTVYAKDGKQYVLPIGATMIDFAAKIHSDYVRYSKGGCVNGEEFSPMSRILKQGDMIELVMQTDRSLPWTFSVDDYEHTKTEYAKNIMRRDLIRCVRAYNRYHTQKVPLEESGIFSDHRYDPEHLKEFAHTQFVHLMNAGHEKWVKAVEERIPDELPFSIPFSRIWDDCMNEYLKQHAQKFTNPYPFYESFAAFYNLDRADVFIKDTFMKFIESFTQKVRDTKFSVGDKAGELAAVLEYARKTGTQVVDVGIQYIPDPNRLKNFSFNTLSGALITVYTEEPDL